jgi:hypothetical protein
MASGRCNGFVRLSIWLAAGAFGPAGCSDPSSPAVATPQTMTATIVAGSDGQTGVVGATLGNPLRLQVRVGGAPKAGVSVHWHTQSGSLEPAESITDADGFAEAAWTLGTVAQFTTAEATVAGLIGRSPAFNAKALAGPAAAIDAVSGSGQTFPANVPSPDQLVARVTDRYRNAVRSQAVTWTVERGPVRLLFQGGETDAGGRSVSAIAPSGGTGDALVRATLPGVDTADFVLSVGPPAFEVLLTTTGTYAFVSSQNGSHPAMDTIPAGGTMVWTIEFDYDRHGVTSVGTPAFKGGDYPWASPSIVSVTFPTPGTYHYADPYYPVATGILVVR